MGYCFMTIEKIKDKGTMSKKYNHNYRKDEVINADKDLEHLNEEIVKLDKDNDYKTHSRTYVDAFNDKMKELGHEKIRKNGVLALEIVTTFSREDAETIDIEKWKKNQVEWLDETFNKNKKDYGDNIVSVMYHGDENGNVHCHSIVVPIDDKGNLNASYYLDGRVKLIQLQDSYGKKMSDEHGLDRGLKGSVAKHEDIKRFYAQANKALEQEGPKVEKINGRLETAEEYKKRSDEVIKDLNLRILSEQKKAERKKAENITIDINEKLRIYEQQKKIEKEIEIINSVDDISTVINKAKTMDILNEGIGHFPDKKKAKDTLDAIKEIIDYEKELIENNKQNNI